VGAGRLGTQLPRERVQELVAEAPLQEPSVAVHKLGPSAGAHRLAAGRLAVLVHRLERAVVVVALPLEQLLGSIAGTRRGPCMLWNHHDR